MISDYGIANCEGLPPELTALLDRPWHFLGEINPRDDAPSTRAVCQCDRSEIKPLGEMDLLVEPTRNEVVMQRYKFVTDDMIEVICFIGACQKCPKVHWARLGPPFRRVRSFVPV